MPSSFKSALALTSVWAILALLAGQASNPSGPIDVPTDEPALRKLQAEAEALRPLVKSQLGKAFLAAAERLPAIKPRQIFRDKNTRQWLTESQAAALSPEQREALEARPVDETLYYNTKYGSPLAYSRPVDLLGQRGVAEFAGKKILDFGYGTVGHLRMMASSGAHVTGLDVDPFLTALYSDPTDQGEIASDQGKPGSITLLSGRFSDESINVAVGGGYDIIISKNTLKRGYIHPPPEENVDKRMLIDLGLSDEDFLRSLHGMLKPGGRIIIYNICPKPAPPGEKYIPWADGRCPFDRALLENAGFVIVEFDRDDSEAARAMGRALGWDQGPNAMDLENDLFAFLTIVAKPIDG